MLFWVPLMQGGGKPATVERWCKLAMAKVPEQATRGNLATVVGFFAELAGCRMVWRSVLEGWNVQESAFANELIEIGEERGELKHSRAYLLGTIQRRFPGSLTTDFVEMVNQQESVALLDSWSYDAATSSSFDQFLATLRG